MPKLICPFCKKLPASETPGVWPFCSERCKTADLGNWASERYRVAGEAPVDDNEEDDEGEDPATSRKR